MNTGPLHIKCTLALQHLPRVQNFAGLSPAHCPNRFVISTVLVKTLEVGQSEVGEASYLVRTVHAAELILVLYPS